MDYNVVFNVEKLWEKTNVVTVLLYHFTLIHLNMRST